jgi:RNA polymerase sigma factor (sigma-70 family)
MEHSVKHLRAVLSVARTILMNLADAEEVAQEAVLKALSNIQGFRGQTTFSTWLIQITVNEAGTDFDRTVSRWTGGKRIMRTSMFRKIS